MDAKRDEPAATPQLIASSSSSFSSSSSSSFCSCEGCRKEAEVIMELRRSTTEGKEEKDRDEAGGAPEGVSDGADDGYHTPTSPEHRIPASKECPVAPKKSSRFQLRRKARVGGGAGQSSGVRRQLIFDLSVELGDFLQKNKKARREAAIAK